MKSANGAIDRSMELVIEKADKIGLKIEGLVQLSNWKWVIVASRGNWELDKFGDNGSMVVLYYQGAHDNFDLIGGYSGYSEAIMAFSQVVADKEDPVFKKAKKPTK